jgi:hypothetical protein
VRTADPAHRHLQIRYLFRVTPQPWPARAGLIRSRSLRSGPAARTAGGYGGSSPREITDGYLPNLAGLQQVDADVPVAGQ